jgi:hypothetical protein
MRVAVLIGVHLVFLGLQWSEFKSCHFQLQVWLLLVYSLTLVARVLLCLVKCPYSYLKSAAMVTALLVLMPISLCLAGSAWLGTGRIHVGDTCVLPRQLPVYFRGFLYFMWIADGLLFLVSVLYAAWKVLAVYCDTSSVAPRPQSEPIVLNDGGLKGSELQLLANHTERAASEGDCVVCLSEIQVKST